MGPVEGERLTTLLVDGATTGTTPSTSRRSSSPTRARCPSSTLDGGLQLTVLSPRPQQLAKLRPVWEPLVREHGLDPAVEPAEPDPLPPELEPLGTPSVQQLAASAFKPTSTEANGSSIVVLAEFEGHRALLCADGFPEVIRGVGRAAARRRRTRLALDAFKLPHHGSRANLNLDLLRRVSAPLHLVSSDGTSTHHPQPRGDRAHDRDPGQPAAALQLPHGVHRALGTRSRRPVRVAGRLLGLRRPRSLSTRVITSGVEVTSSAVHRKDGGAARSRPCARRGARHAHCPWSRSSIARSSACRSCRPSAALHRFTHGRFHGSSNRRSPMANAQS